MKAFSVSMCVYGGDNPAWFAAAVDSVVNQTVAPDEIVIVVDGPVPPELDAVIGGYEQQPLFKVIRMAENRGHGEARRIGLQHCTCDLIALMDADDISRPDRFEKQLAAFDEGVAIVGGQITEFIDTTDHVVGKIYYVQTGGGRRRGIPIGYEGDKTSFIAKDTGGLGALGDIGCYSLDMVLNALGHPKPLTVTGYTSDFFGKDPNYVAYKKFGRPEFADAFGVDDFAAAFIRLEGGIILDFRIAWAMNLDTAGDTIIYGTKGSLRIPSTECWNGTIGGNLVIYHEVAGKQVETEIEKIPQKSGVPTCKEQKIRTFLDAIKEGGEAPVPTSEILYNQAILDHIVKSAELGREVEVVIPEI